jgi:dCMP deaminase
MRPDWDEYYMQIARYTAVRATCNRKHVGCVITVGNRVVAGGYNGAPAGLDHCDDAGHDMVDTHCIRVVHAEANTVADAARRGVSLNRGTVYVTAMPCWPCFKLLVQAGIKKVVYSEAYRIEDKEMKRVFAAAQKLDIGILHLPEDKEAGPPTSTR